VEVELKLVIGNKNYSSWSMRPWILLKYFDVDFEEISVDLFVDGYDDELAKFSPHGKVPVLLDGEHRIWDSLAICEYVSEKYLSGAALPEELHARARCRSYCSEMHSGFHSIRNELPMNCRAQRLVEFSAGSLADIKRIDTLWMEARSKVEAEGEYLFGDFSLADCLYAPVVMRFHCYRASLSEVSQRYMQAILDNSAVRNWCEEARAETQILPDFEIGTEISD